MDQICFVYQKVICVFIVNVNNLWKEYDQFEMSLNKFNGCKNFVEWLLFYMMVKSVYIVFENIICGLQWMIFFVFFLVVVYFDGYQEYME